MQTLLYSIGYVALGTAVALVFTAVGFLFLPRLRADSLPVVVWSLLVRYGLGMAVISGMVVWMGLAGEIHWWTVWPAAIALAVAGAVRGSRATRIDRASVRERLRHDWRGLAAWERGLALVAGVWIALLFLNLLIGGLLPDTGMDAMWYHLTLPGQWVLTGRIDTYPHCMPSNYPLGVEAIYAALLLVSDEVLCVFLYAEFCILLFVGFLALLWKWGGFRAVLYIVIGGISLLATVAGMAPLGALNDAAATLLLLLAFGILFDPFHPDRNSTEFLSPPMMLAVGFLLGTALAMKLTVLPFAFGIGAAACGGLLLWRRGIRNALLAGILLVAGVAIAYLPWAVRGFLGSGNPVFPLLSGLFPVREAYRFSMQTSKSLNALYPFTLSGLKEAITVGIPLKFKLLGSSVDTVSFLGLLSAIAILLIRDKRFWVLQSLLVLFFYATFLLFKGHNEVLRYFSASYPISFLLFGRFLDRLCARISPGPRLGFLAVLFAAGLYTFGHRQLDVARFKTIQWKFTPVVTPAERTRFAAHTEGGGHYLAFQSIRTVIPPDAYVLMPQTSYAYYLKRRALWNLGNDWKEMTPEQAVDYVRRGPFDYCVFENKSDPRARAILQSPYVQRLNWTFPQAPTWAVCRVLKPATSP